MALRPILPQFPLAERRFRLPPSPAECPPPAVVACRPDGAYWYTPRANRMARPSVSPETEVVEREQLVPLYRVVLLDDNDHTYDYVIEMLQKIFIFSLDEAYRHAEEVD